MRQLTATALAGLFLAAAAAAAPEDEILGRWLTKEGRSIVEIYRQGKQLRGKIVYLKEPLDDQGRPKLDTNNPDASKHDRPVLGMDVVSGFRYEGDGKWDGGRAYDPKNGKSYHCSMRIKDGQVYLRGSLDRWGVLGRTEIWTRASTNAPAAPAAAE